MEGNMASTTHSETPTRTSVTGSTLTTSFLHATLRPWLRLQERGETPVTSCSYPWSSGQAPWGPGDPPWGTAIPPWGCGPPPWFHGTLVLSDGETVLGASSGAESVSGLNFSTYTFNLSTMTATLNPTALTAVLPTPTLSTAPSGEGADGGNQTETSAPGAGSGTQSRLSPATVAGIGVGSAAAVIIFIFLVLFICRRRRRASHHDTMPDTPTTPTAEADGKPSTRSELAATPRVQHVPTDIRREKLDAAIALQKAGFPRAWLLGAGWRRSRRPYDAEDGTVYEVDAGLPPTVYELDAASMSSQTDSSPNSPNYPDDPNESTEGQRDHSNSKPSASNPHSQKPELSTGSQPSNLPSTSSAPSGLAPTDPASHDQNHDSESFVSDAPVDKIRKGQSRPEMEQWPLRNNTRPQRPVSPCRPPLHVPITENDRENPIRRGPVREDNVAAVDELVSPLQPTLSPIESGLRGNIDHRLSAVSQQSCSTPDGQDSGLDLPLERPSSELSRREDDRSGYRV